MTADARVVNGGNEWPARTCTLREHEYGSGKKIKTILFATDFSPACGGALQWAASLAHDLDAKLIILHVEQPAVPYGGGEVYSSYVLDHHSRSLAKMLENVKPADSQVSSSRRMSIGDPATEIVRVAEEENADMIVMSTHARSGLPRVLIGSVAETVPQLVRY